MFPFRRTILSMQKNERGAAALLTIVLIGAATLLMAVSVARLSVGELEMGYLEGKGSSALASADGCAEEALQRLRKNNSYTGGTFSVGGASCIIVVTGSGASRTISSTATVDTFTKKIQMQVAINNAVLTIVSWNESSP